MKAFLVLALISIQAVAGPCDNFAIFEAIPGQPAIKATRPDFKAFGIVHMDQVYPQALYRRDANGIMLKTYDPQMLEAASDGFKGYPGYLMIDIEHIGMGPDMVRQFVEIYGVFKAKSPRAQIGFYGSAPPFHIYHAVVNDPAIVAKWRAVHDAEYLRPLYTTVDWLQTSAYTFKANMLNWRDNVVLKLKEGQRLMGEHAPVHAWMNPRYIPGSERAYQWIPRADWLFQLRTLKAAGAEAVVLWTEPNAWRTEDENNWWSATKEFIATDCGGQLGVPRAVNLPAPPEPPAPPTLEERVDRLEKEVFGR